MMFLDMGFVLVVLFFAGPVTFVVALVLWRNFRTDRGALPAAAAIGTTVGTLLVPGLTFVFWQLPLDGGFIQLLLAPIAAGAVLMTVFLAWPQKPDIKR
jgi:hypothetical protein